MSKKFSLNKLDKAFIRVYREDARLEQNSQCDYCYERLTYRTTTADHILAKKNNGNNSKENISAACKPCNQAKGHMTVNQYKNLIKSSVIPTGKPWPIIMAWNRRRINLALNRLEKKVMAAVGKKQVDHYCKT